MEEDKLKEKVLKFYPKPYNIEKPVFDSFLKNHSKFFKKSIKIDIGEGKVSNGDSIQFLFSSKKEILVRIKKITGKNMFDSLKTEWKEFIIDKEKTITEDESLFSLTDNEKRLFQKIKEIKSLINISYEEDYLDFIKRGTGPKSKINYYSYPEIDDETNIKNYSDHEVVKVKNNSKIYFLIDKTVDNNILIDYLKKTVVNSYKRLNKNHINMVVYTKPFFLLITVSISGDPLH